jgi:hypothetical protein
MMPGITPMIALDCSRTAVFADQEAWHGWIAAGLRLLPSQRLMPTQQERLRRGHALAGHRSRQQCS